MPPKKKDRQRKVTFKLMHASREDANAQYILEPVAPKKKYQDDESLIAIADEFSGPIMKRKRGAETVNSKELANDDDDDDDDDYFEEPQRILLATSGPKTKQQKIELAENELYRDVDADDGDDDINQYLDDENAEFEELDTEFMKQLQGKAEIPKPATTTTTTATKAKQQQPAKKRKFYESSDDEGDDPFGDDQDMNGDDNDDDIDLDNIDDLPLEFAPKRPLPTAQSKVALDQQFEIVLKQYDEEQIGELEDEDIRGNFAVKEVDKLLDEFLDSKKSIFDLTDEQLQAIEAKDPERAAFLRVRRDKRRIPKEEVDALNKRYFAQAKEEEQNPQPEQYDLVALKEEEKFDCQSILSTLSNLENHPTLIREAAKKKKREQAAPKEIKLSTKTGMPVGYLPTNKPVQQQQQPEQVTQVSIGKQAISMSQRDPNESKEDKKLRKQMVKDQKKAKREIKKTLKTVFKDEEKRQVAINSMPHVHQKVVVKY